MKLFLITALALGTSLPAEANSFQSGFSTSRVCTRMEYREEYVPGTHRKPGYIRTFKERVKVPCRNQARVTQPTYRSAPYQRFDNNDCSDGTVMGGILGGGIATSISRGKDRWWAIPAGIFGGSMLGCQIDGG